MEQKHQADHCHNDHLFDQGVGQSLHRPIDQVGAVVGDRDLHVLWKAGPELLETLLDALDHSSGIGPRTDYHDAANCFPLSVPVGQTPTDLRSDGDSSHIPDKHRYATGACREHDIFQILNIFHIAQTPDHELALGELYHPSTDIDIGALDCLLDLTHRNAIGAQRLPDLLPPDTGVQTRRSTPLRPRHPPRSGHSADTNPGSSADLLTIDLGN